MNNEIIQTDDGRSMDCDENVQQSNPANPNQVIQTFPGSNNPQRIQLQQVPEEKEQKQIDLTIENEQNRDNIPSLLMTPPLEEDRGRFRANNERPSRFDEPQDLNTPPPVALPEVRLTGQNQQFKIIPKDSQFVQY